MALGRADLLEHGRAAPRARCRDRRVSVPYRRRPPVSPLDLWRRLYEGKFFYQLYFLQVGVVEAELEADVRTALRKIYYSISGDAASLDGWLDRPAEGGLLAGMIDPDPFPAWMTPADLDYFTAAFEAGGFRGPINRYRNQAKDFETLPEMGARAVEQPSCFVADAGDVVRRFVPGRDGYENIDGNCTDFRFSRILDGAGHRVRREAPEAVDTALLEFLASPRS